MNQPPQSQPPQQPPPQPQIHQVTDTKSIIRQPKSKDDIKAWSLNISYSDNAKKSNEIRSKSIITPKFAYDFEKSDFSRVPYFDKDLIKNIETCINLTPTATMNRLKIDPIDRKLNMPKCQSVEYRGPEKMKRLQNFYQRIQQQMKQAQKQQQTQQMQQQIQQCQQQIQNIEKKKEQYEKEQTAPRNLLKQVCLETVKKVPTLFKLQCNQPEDISNSLQQFIYQELINILSFSNQNSRQRTNYYVPLQNMSSLVTNVPKYSQKIIQFEDIIYSKWWKTAFDDGYGSGNPLNPNPINSDISPLNTDSNNEMYTPNFDESDFNEFWKLFKDSTSFHDLGVRYNNEQLAKVVVNSKRRVLTQNGPWKEDLIKIMNKSNFDNNTFSQFSKSLEVISQQTNQMQNPHQQVQQIPPGMMQTLSPQAIQLSNVTSPNLQPMNQRNFLSSPATVASPASGNITNPTASVPRRQTSTANSHIPPSLRMSSQFIEFLNSEENKKRKSRVITMSDVYQCLEMKTRIGQNVRTYYDLMSNLKMSLFIHDTRSHQNKHMQQQKQQQMQQQQMQQQQMQQMQQQMQPYH